MVFRATYPVTGVVLRDDEEDSREVATLLLI